MRLTYFVLAALLTSIASPARADLLRAKQASVMCSSASALAKLSKPGGGSTDAGIHVSPAILKIARAGNCIDFSAGHVVIVEKARLHTSVVRSDSLSGDGVMIEVIVANIDFNPYVPPHDGFYDIIRTQCPKLLEGIAAESPPSEQFVESLPSTVRISITKALDENCGPDGNCLTHNRTAEIARRHLRDQWAEFLCAHPRLAVEPTDQSAGAARD